MSYFIVYVEIGPHLVQEAPARPWVAKPVLVHNLGRKGPAKQGAVLSDGISADHITKFGSSAVARKGEEMRNEFMIFLQRRLGLGAHPYFALVWMDGVIAAQTLALDQARKVPIEHVVGLFRQLATGEVLAIIA